MEATCILAADSPTHSEISNLTHNSRNTVFRAHQRLVAYIVRRIYHPGISLEWGDLMQEGNLGLLRAITHFKPTPGGARFTTYAYPWIFYAIRSALRKEKLQWERRGEFDSSSNQWLDLAGDPEEQYCLQETLKQMPLLRRLIVRLPRPERSVIQHRYGLVQGNSLRMLRQCSRRFRMSETTIWRLEQHALTLLRLYADAHKKGLLSNI